MSYIRQGLMEAQTINYLKIKNHGYHLEHNFGHGNNNLSEAFFLLNLLAFFFHQIFELTDLLYQSARAEFSARVEFWNAIRSVFRFFFFESWENPISNFHPGGEGCLTSKTDWFTIAS